MVHLHEHKKGKVVNKLVILKMGWSFDVIHLHGMKGKILKCDLESGLVF